MSRWRSAVWVLALLFLAALAFLALSPAQAEGPATLSPSKGGALLAATPIVREFPVVTHTAEQWRPAISGNLVVWQDWRNGNGDIYGARLERPPAPGACSLTGTVREQSGSYYLEEAGRPVAFLYGESVNFAAYLGQRVTVGGPCKVWRESAGPRPVFLAQTIISAAIPTGPPAKLPRGATRGW